MESALAEILKKIEELSNKIDTHNEAVKSLTLSSTELVQHISNSIEQKLDIIANIQPAPKAASSAKPKSTLTSEKALFKDYFAKLKNIIYSEDDLNKLSNVEAVATKRTSTTKLNAKRTLMFDNMLKKNNLVWDEDVADEKYARFKVFYEENVEEKA